MEEKKQLGEKLGEFFAGKGFYIVLLLCAGLIATSIWLMADRSGADVEPTGKTNAGTASVSSDELPSLPAMKVVEDPTVPTEAPRRPTTGKLPPLSEEEEAPAAVPVPEPPVTEVMAVEEPAPPVDYFIWPVNGALLRAYSVEALSYDPTMGDWRVHGGWDIAAPLGEPVLSTANGRVTAVSVDEDLGGVVEVSHSNGLSSVYANLDTECPVHAGQIVSVGSVLGTVGSLARSESGQASHLHFELRRGGESVDPADWLPQP